VRIGYVTPNSWGVDSPQEVVELAVEAEQLGAESLWVSHHVLHRGFVAERLTDGRPYHDPLVMLAAFASATDRARLGTSVLVVPYLHPMPTAKTVATIDHLSRGRVELGVGVGGLRVEHDTIGQVPFEQRGRYADEFLEVMQGLWTPGPSSFHGRHFHFDDLEAYPGPYNSTGIPIAVGGHGPAALRRAARFGSAWHALGLEPDQVDGVRASLGEVLVDHGRSIEGFPFELRLHIPIDDLDVGAWRDRVAAYADAGVDELVLAPQSGDVDAHHRWLDTLLAALVS
jgi:probable F420-dependent oxidoreductase